MELLFFASQEQKCLWYYEFILSLWPDSEIIYICYIYPLHFADLLLSDVLVIGTSWFLAWTCFLAGQWCLLYSSYLFQLKEYWCLNSCSWIRFFFHWVKLVFHYSLKHKTWKVGRFSKAWLFDHNIYITPIFFSFMMWTSL